MIFARTRSARRASPDYLIITCFTILVIFGLAMISSASSHLGKIKFNDTYYYLKHQLAYGLSLGIIGFFLMSRIYYKRLEKFALPFLIISLGLLVLVFTPLGVKTKGAARWVNIGPITFQPSEIIKITFLVYLASWLSRRDERQTDFKKGLVPFFIIISVIASLLIKQPSTSTVAILLLTAFIVYFMSGSKLSYTLGIILISAAIFLIIIFSTPYRFERVKSFLDPTQNLETSSFHLNQALIAIGSGGLTGVGYGQSTTKISYLPEPVGDSIFAVIAEEFGFIGSTVLITVYLILIFRIFNLSRKVRDKFAKLLLIAFGSIIAIQTCVHIAAISGLLPLTGTPLPFISYGGTALAVFMTMAGIIVNISKYA